MWAYVTRPGKTGLIYTKCTCSYYGIYLLFCMCYPKSVSFIEFFMHFCIIIWWHFRSIQITDKELLHFNLSKSGQNLRIDKTSFPRPSHICISLVVHTYHIVGKFSMENLAYFIFQGLRLIVSVNLDDFSLADHRWLPNCPTIKYSCYS